MGNFTKWLGAGLGFTLGGPIGSIIGFAVGSFVDGFSKEDILKEGVSSLDDQEDSEIDLELDNSNMSERKSSLKKSKFINACNKPVCNTPCIPKRASLSKKKPGKWVRTQASIKVFPGPVSVTRIKLGS